MKASVTAFLRSGLLPDNLPPFLSSTALVDPVLGDEDSWHIGNGVTGKPSIFNGSKRGFQRRVFSLPHPAFIRDQALVFRKHSRDIEKIFDKSSLSQSRPTFEKRSQRAIRFTPHSALPAIRLKRLAKFKYCLVTDVSRCFPSIYTHSLPWALHGKLKAKKDRKIESAAVWGNRLDFLFRQSQDGQTTGIPVGPDSSRVAAEIVLSAVDAVFQSKAGDECGIRHVDDYWIGGESQQSCEESLHRLRSSLNEFSLDINEQKTRIIPTSSVISEIWPYDLESQLHLALSDGQDGRHEGRIVSLLGSVVEQSAKASDDGIVKFFLRKIDEWQVWDTHWDLLEPFLAHCAVQFPHSFDYVARVISWRRRREEEYSKNLWFDVVRSVIAQASRMARDAEVLWGLWLAKELGMRLKETTFKAIVDNNSPIVVGALAHFAVNNRTSFAPNLSELWERVESDPLSGSQWPLALELNHLRVKRPRRLALDGPDVLKSIFSDRVSLIDWDALPQAFTDDGEVIEIPEFALSGSSSYYDDDDDDDDDWPDIHVGEVPF